MADLVAHKSTTRALALAALALLLGLGSGCKRPHAEDYDRRTVVLLTQLTQALESGDHATAAARATELQAARKSDAATESMVQVTAEGYAVAQVNGALRQGDIAGALAICDEQLRLVDQGPDLRAARPQLQRLQTIAVYRAQPLPLEATAAAAAVATLPPPASLGIVHPPYALWYARQQAQVAVQAQKEQQRQREDLLARLDLALVTREVPLAGLVATQLGRLGGSASERQWPAWVAGQLTANEVQAQPEGAARELLVYLLERQDPAQARRFYPAAGTDTPLTLCGAYVQVVAALDRQDLVGGLADLRRLQVRAPGVDTAPLVRRVRALLMANGVGTMTPTVPQVLNVWYHLQAPTAP